MSINGILSNAYTGLSVSQSALRVTANNIANVNTPGYGRQQVQLESLIAGSQGAGVRISEIMRVADRFLEQSVYESQSDAARYTALRDFHDRFQGLLGRPDSNGTISARLEKAFTALSEATLDPADVVRRQGALSDLARFADEVSRVAISLQGLRADASNQITETVNNINTILKRIHNLNPQIVKAKTTTGELGPLEEQRAQALSELSKLIDINSVELPDGSVSVTTSTGITLLDNQLRQFSYVSPGTATAGTNFAHIELHSVDPATGNLQPNPQELDGDILSGRLRGLLDLRDKDLPSLAENLGELARVFTDQINAIHNSNASLPAANTLTGRNLGLVGADLLNFSGTTDFAVIDGQGKVVNKVTVDLGALGAGATINDLITAVNTGLGGDGALSISGGKLSFSATAASNGVVIADDPADPSQRAGRGLSHFFGMNDLIQGQAASHYDTGFAGTEQHNFTAGQTMSLELRDPNNRSLTNYTLTISGSTFDDLLADLNAPGALGNYATFALDANGMLTVTPKPGYGDLQTRIISDSTNRGGTGVTLSDLFGMKHGTLANAARDLQVKSEITSNPLRLSLAKFDRSAAIGATAVGIGDNRGALALSDLQLINTNFARAGSLSEVTTSLSQYSAFVLGEAAIMAESATQGEEDANALQVDVTQRRDDFSGVNLDEELSNMITYQNAYSASARMMSAARDLYDALLQIV